MTERIRSIVRAIEKNGYRVDVTRDIRKIDRAYGILGRQKVKDRHGRREKYLLYTEGTTYQKGYLTGALVEPLVRKMTGSYVNNVIWAFFSPRQYNPNWVKNMAGAMIAALGYLFSRRMKKDICLDYKREMDGILDGCRSSNGKTRVKAWRIWMLNTGVDAILSVMYTGKLGIFRPIRLSRRYHPRIPFMCNAFSIHGKLTEHGDLFFGRDFMFPTAAVFHVAAVQIVHRTEKGRVYTGITAPGMAGMMTGLNAEGLAMGVNMVPAGNCNPYRPGMNSLLMVRHCIDKADTLDEAVRRIKETRRGVAWIYCLAHGKSKNACIVEAGRTRYRGRFTKDLPDSYRRHLPDRKYLEEHPTVAYQRGIMVRYAGCDSLTHYQRFNKDLFSYYAHGHPHYTYRYKKADFEKKGMLDKTWTDASCPGTRYFPPQREDSAELLIATNFFMIPEMRLFQMAPVSDEVSKHNQDDFQWRYDILNRLLLRAIPRKKSAPKVSFSRAREIIEFLDPKYTRINHEYYIKKSGLKDHIRVEGSVSICNATRLIMETKVGYWEDPWIRLDLKDFL